MLNLIADHPILFALFICIITGIPMAIWWLRYNNAQKESNAKKPGIQFTCICGKTLPSKIEFDTHQQDGSCPKLPAKTVTKPTTHPNPSVKSKPSLLQKPIAKSKAIVTSSKKQEKATPKAPKKSMKIKPRDQKKSTSKKTDEDIISINEFEKNTAKIVISKR